MSGIVWNPLTDDGDALRLAVKLRMEVYYRYDEGDAVYANFTNQIGETVGYCAEYYDDLTQLGDAFSATRRAIVRAAAST